MLDVVCTVRTHIDKDDPPLNTRGIYLKVGFLPGYPNLELSLFKVGDLELCSVMLNLPDVPGQAGIGTLSLSLKCARRFRRQTR